MSGTEQQLLQLQYAVEQFDLNQASSVAAGTFHNGRRRELHITRFLESLCLVELHLHQRPL